MYGREGECVIGREGEGVKESVEVRMKGREGEGV